jgi:DNA-binding Xre family transcriptional regulator
MDILAKNLKQLLKDKKIKRKDLACGIHIPKRTLDGKLDKHVTFTEKEIHAIKKYLNVTYDKLLEGA